MRPMSMPLYRLPGKNAQPLDFKCVEFAEDLLYVSKTSTQRITEVWICRTD
jgi:hypothetical protein